MLQLFLAAALLLCGAYINANDPEIESLARALKAIATGAEQPIHGGHLSFPEQEKLDQELLKTTSKVDISVEDIKKLLDKGANVNAKDLDDWTPLIKVCFQNNFEVAKLLIEKGANVNAKNLNNQTPLLEACFHYNFKLVKLLIENSANVNAKNNQNKTPLDIAIKTMNHPRSSKASQYIPLIRLLVENGASLFTISGGATSPWETISPESHQEFIDETKKDYQNRADLLLSLFPLKLSPTDKVYRPFFKHVVSLFAKSMTNSIDSATLSEKQMKKLLKFQAVLTLANRKTIISIIQKLIKLLYLGKQKFMEELTFAKKDTIGFTDEERGMCQRLFTDDSPLLNFIISHSPGYTYFSKNLKNIMPEPVEKKGKKKKPYEDIKIFFKKFYEK
ncbi:TPA: hypothetical protein DDZ86_01480 [Candidatus Dependentiae bacterium]|nr:MAG: hypothetical protein UW09_C0001G0341 [candidate division TM6 bacterium GW2011_GWF2_43_87]HBL98295.1 hypothetical protein [Candidatus Dependentiae bacterium]